MSTAALVVRRVAAVVLGAGALLAAGAATAAADPGPGCMASDITGVESQVAGAMTAYFLTHPDVNVFFSGLQGLPREDAFNQAKGYLDANPTVKADINAIRGPVLDLRNRCNIPNLNLIRGVL